jgi:hypothetical protein
LQPIDSGYRRGNDDFSLLLRLGEDLAEWLRNGLAASRLSASPPGDQIGDRTTTSNKIRGRALCAWQVIANRRRVRANDGEWRIMMEKKTFLLAREVSAKTQSTDADSIFQTIEHISGNNPTSESPLGVK